MYVIERPAKLLDIPGGQSRSEYLGFWMNQLNCTGDRDFCASFGGKAGGTAYAGAVAALRAQADPVVRIRLRFYFDGAKTVECRLEPDAARRKAIFDYLDKKGWAMSACAA
jgi:hypothetical protein